VIFLTHYHAKKTYEGNGGTASRIL